MAFSHDDSLRLHDAVELAHCSIGLSDPNPRVGCLIHDAGGEPVGRGFTQQAGGPHAEIVALRDAAGRGRSVAGGTAWVSLEPCAHHGRTPPCCDALIKAGLARVVVAMRDPFPGVAGQGIARLRASGVRVDVAPADDPAVAAAKALNVGFLSRVVRGRPWVRMKIAASLDGRTALPDGQSQWITGLAARSDGQLWRRRASAVLTGIGTIVDDDPRLDVRDVPTVLQPMRVIVDSTLRLAATARVLQPPGTVTVVTASADAARAAALQARGAAVLQLPGADGRVDLERLISTLAVQGVNELHVEAGAVLNGALLAADLVDELLLYTAPTLLGPGRVMAQLPTLAALPAPGAWRFVESAPVGTDLRLRLVRQGAEEFLSSGVLAGP